MKYQQNIYLKKKSSCNLFHLRNFSIYDLCFTHFRIKFFFFSQLVITNLQAQWLKKKFCFVFHFFLKTESYKLSMQVLGIFWVFPRSKVEFQSCFPWRHLLASATWRHWVLLTLDFQFRELGAGHFPRKHLTFEPFFTSQDNCVHIDQYRPVFLVDSQQMFDDNPGLQDSTATLSFHSLFPEETGWKKELQDWNLFCLASATYQRLCWWEYS